MSESSLSRLSLFKPETFLPITSIYLFLFVEEWKVRIVTLQTVLVQAFIGRRHRFSAGTRKQGFFCIQARIQVRVQTGSQKAAKDYQEGFFESQ
jgi:hypothetical protein